MITLAIPNKGRMNGEILRLLEKIGLDIPEDGRKLYATTSNPNIRVVYARAADIPLYVQSGAADIGITGEDMIDESGVEIKKLLKLNFGSCKVAVATPVDSKIKKVSDYFDGIRVATKLPNIAEKYFKSKSVNCKIIRISGATELAPYLGIADIIVDQVSTGTTLAANNLQRMDTISTSSIFLIANSNSLKEKESDIDELKISLEGVITAESKRYIMVNVSGDQTLERVVKVMPAMDSPTVLKLAEEGKYSVHSVVDAKELISAIRKIRQAGATDILVMNMSRVVE
ncbi:ATP phosphoribosyltransferase [Candidatus Micrarchaeota archaeon]|nr:ATP phosphoribosyltransferase [Candidatus Micrarchaeota archaeon]